MDKDVLRTIIREGQEEISSVRPELYNRPFSFEENGRYVLTGVRHAGKSYMLYQFALELIKEGHSLEDMLYVNFDDERLYGLLLHRNWTRYFKLMRICIPISRLCS